jgi:hypothetical protein
MICFKRGFGVPDICSMTASVTVLWSMARILFLLLLQDVFKTDQCPRYFRRITAWCPSGVSPKTRSIMWVSMMPGQMALMRMLDVA